MKKEWLRLWLMGVFIFCLVLPLLALAADQTPRPGQWATPVNDPALKNFYKVDDHLYRSAQPDDTGMKALEQRGIKSVLNLREFHSDKDEAEGTALKLIDVPMNAAKIKDEDVITALKTIQSAQGPILVHCWHGSDRTGAVIAMYRIIIQGWSKQAAIDELVNGGYGYHSIYGNIVQYLENVNVTGIKSALASGNQGKDGK
ncbi:MAG: dual specificity protein phosphatase family protein [Desulfobacteraceae bacterium]|nr:dual specificity protein phosphatase family protein [Desulfobacteraceae bacterium]